MVCHPSQEYLDDVKSLSQYIEEELNVRALVCTSDETRCGVKWQLEADYAVLGRKLRKDMPKVKAALANVTSEEAKAYIKSGKITVAGVDLVAGDLSGVLTIGEPQQSADGSDYESQTDKDVVVLLDALVRPEYEDEALARDFVNKVQKARKEARLMPTDEINVYAKSDSAEASEAFGRLLKTQTETLQRVLKKAPMDSAQLPSGAVPFWQSAEDTPVEVGDYKYWLTFVKL